MLRADEFKQGASLGKYEIIKKLAVGGMAEIYLARVRGTAGFEKLVVLKRILPSVAEDATFVQMFLDEARLAATLRHPNIGDVFDVGAENNSYYFAMEFIQGQDARAIRLAAYELDRDIPIEIALAIISGTAYALAYAHAKTGPNGPLGIVHRDITPSNILVSYDGAVKLVDFGIARADSRVNSVKTRTGTLKGKVPYMSPEQCKGKQLDRRSDLFSLGTVLYELTTGQRPFEGHSEYDTLEMIVHGRLKPPSTLMPAYPTELEDIVMKLLAREPAGRYQDADSVLLDLEKLTSEAGLLVSERAVAKYMQEVFAEEIAEWENAVIGGVTAQSVPAFSADIATGSGELDPFSPPQATTTTPYGAPAVARSGLSLDLDDPTPPLDPPHPFESTREYPRGAGRPPSHLLPDDPPTLEVKLEAATDEPLHGLLVTPDVQVFVRTTRSGIPHVGDDDPADLPIARAPTRAPSPTTSAATRAATLSPPSRASSPSITRTTAPMLPRTSTVQPTVPRTPTKPASPAITRTPTPPAVTRTPTPRPPLVGRAPTPTATTPRLPVPHSGDFADESPTAKATPDILRRAIADARATRDDLRRAIAETRGFDPDETRRNDNAPTQGGGIDQTRFDAVLQFDPILARGDDILDDVDAKAPKHESKDERALRRIIELARRARSWLATGDIDQAVIAAELAFEEDVSDPLVHAILDRETTTFHMAYETFLGDLRRPALLGRPLSELADLKLDQRAAFLLSRIDGRSSFEELLDTAGMSRFEASRHLCRLVFRKMILVG